MRKHKTTAILGASIGLALAALGSGPASASAAPEWGLEIVAPDRVVPGETFRYGIVPRNVGDASTDGTGALDITLPPGFKGVAIGGNPDYFPLLWKCSDPSGAQTVHCDYEPPFPLGVGPGEIDLGSPLTLEAEVEPDASGDHTALFQMSGGGVPAPDSVQSEVRASPSTEFRITEWGGHIATDEEGKLPAGSHPEDIVTTLAYSTRENTKSDDLLPDTAQRNLTADLPAGFVGAPAVVPTCELKDLVPVTYEPLPGEAPVGLIPACSIETIVGSIGVRLGNGEVGQFSPRGVITYHAPIFNMKPSPGEPARFGFKIHGVPLELVANVRTDGDLGVQLTMRDTSQGLPLIGATTTFWGTPADPSHDRQRCQYYRSSLSGNANHDDCSTGTPGNPADGINPSDIGSPKPFLTLPTSCNAPGEGLRFDIESDGWAPPHQSDSASFTTYDDEGNGVTGCDRVPFQPSIGIQPTTDEAETPSGLEVALTVPPDGLNNPTGISQSHLKDAKVTLPEGMSINPSYGDGVVSCSASQVGLTSGNSPVIRFNRAPSRCPDASQLADVRIDTPLLKEPLVGAAYVAQQNDPKAQGVENPFDSTLAMYIVVEGSGVLVKLAGRVAPDQKTGQVITTFLNNPQVPFERFSLKFKGGQRAPLSTPPICGTHTATAELTPWARPGSPVTVSDSFNITKGPHGGPCPSGQTPPFKPGLLAGTTNNAAGSYSPFHLRLTREDGEQEFTNFSIKLPPGLIGKLAGIPFCSDSAIQGAKSKSGAEEIANPSCPKASEVGRTEVGAGVGSLLVYAPGKVYLAGPYNGSALSMVAITAAKVGPFDLGTVAIREALRVNPETAEVFIDPTGSDPIPHIIDGIPVHARDIRVFVDRPQFVLNPTSCKRTSTASTVLGSGLDFGSSSDDNPITVTSPFQAADCASLGFKPKLALSLIGGTKRDRNPKFKAVLTARKGDANIGESQVTLPSSEFLDQSHIKTVCTRVQFKEGKVPGEKCPAASVYGYAEAITPILDEPLKGPVFLRSSSHNLPDLLVALHSGKIDVNLAGRIDSVNGRIRNTFEALPDAPVTRFTLTMQGGKKGLLVNSTNLCKRDNRAIVSFTGQNGKVHEFNPVVKPSCKKRKAKKRSARAKG